MPTYVLTDTKTNKTFDKFCSYSNLEKYLKENPHIKKEISAPNIVSKEVKILLAPSLANSFKLCMSDVILATNTPVLFFSK